MPFPHRSRVVLSGIALMMASLLVGCSDDSAADIDHEQVDAVEVPDVGACRVLTPEHVAESSNAVKVVDCAKSHTAETFAAGELPAEFDDAARDDPGLGTFAYTACSDAFADFLGADESLVMRSLLSWAWFRPSEKAWDEGARWYRCDVIGGGDQSTTYVDLPETAEGLFLGKPDDRWMVCADGPSVAGTVKIPCSEPHTWRAVTTIKVGQDKEPYPGDRLVEVKTRDFCSKSVGAWLNYPSDFDYAYTWFHQAEWDAGNRRSICWARTKK